MSYTKFQICNKALGLLSAEPIDVVCSDTAFTTEATCLLEKKNTWTNNVCSDTQFTSEATCIAEKVSKNTWTPATCSDATKNDEATCLLEKKNTWTPAPPTVINIPERCNYNSGKTTQATCEATANHNWIVAHNGIPAFCNFNRGKTTQATCLASDNDVWILAHNGMPAYCGHNKSTACTGSDYNVVPAHTFEIINNSCSDTQFTTEATCLLEKKNTWTPDICSDATKNDEATCIAEKVSKNTWTPATCSDATKNDEATCLLEKKNTWTPDWTSTEGKLCDGQYDILKDALIMEHTWTFSTKRVKAQTVLVEPAVAGNTYKAFFAIPDDSLRIIRVNAGSNIQNIGFDVKINWEITDGKIYTQNATDIFITYIYKIDDTKFSAKFADLLSLKIAAELCYTLTASSRLYEALHNQYRSRLIEAQNIDSLQGTNILINYRKFVR